MGISTQLDDSTLESLVDSVRGEVLQPSDDGYDDARTVWNGTVDKRPALIVRCTGPADVMQSVEFAREHDINLSVKSSGHMTTGNAVCDDGITLDMGEMNAVRVDPNERTVRVEGGATWAQVNHETIPFGLLAPGSPREVGVAGFTLGGGQGYLTRTHGLASDHLREVDLVTADGDLVTANEDTNADLFWALRGGVGNFGVVTSFEFDCFEMSTEFMTGELLYPLDDAPAVFRLFRDSFEEAPDELLSWVSLIMIPDMEGIPQIHHGEPGIHVQLTYVGDPAEAEDAFEPFLLFGDPIVRTTAIKPFPEVELDELMPPGIRRHWESVFLDEITDDLIDLLTSEATSLPSPQSSLTVFWLGGTARRFDREATAFAHRNASFYVMLSANWTDPTDDDLHHSWVREILERVSTHGTGGEFVNIQTDSNEERIRAAFGNHYARLVDVKNKWDPNNLFDQNQNIDPTD